MESIPPFVFESMREDGRFFLRLLKTLIQHPDSGLIAPAVVPLASLFVVESHACLLEYLPNIPPILSDAALAALRPARHRVKMLLSKKDDVASLVAQFESIVQAERKRFIGSHSGSLGWLKRWIQPDLGLSFCSGHMFSTTHATQFMFGADFNAASLHDAGRVLARYCSILDGVFHPTSGVECFPADSLGVVMKDVKCEAVYRSGPLGSLELPWAAVVAMVLSNVNFVDKVLRRIVQGDSRAFFKIRVLCAFHALESLRLVQDCLASKQRLPSAAGTVLRALASPDARWFRKHASLRHALVHFRPRRLSADCAAQSYDAVIGELSGGRSQEEVAAMADRTLAAIARTLESGFALRPRSFWYGHVKRDEASR